MDPVVILERDQIQVTPGQEARLSIRIRNTGRRVEGYRLRPVGPAVPWSRIEPDLVSVYPGKEATAELVVAPPAAATTPNGTLPFGVQASSEVDPDASAVAEGELHIGGVTALEAYVPLTTRRGRWSTTFAIQLANRGNAPMRLAVTAHEPSGEVGFRVLPEVTDLPIGREATVKVKAKARHPFLRGTAVPRAAELATHDFPFGSTPPTPGINPPPGADPQHRLFRVTFNQLPVISKALMAVAALVLVGALLVAVFVLRSGGDDDPELRVVAPPQPTELAAIPSFDRISLTWTPVPGSAGYELWLSDPSGAQTELLAQSEPGSAAFVHEGLEPLAEQCYLVRAVGPAEAGLSPFAGPTCSTTTEAAAVPAPENLTVVVDETNPNRVTLDWDYPEDLVGTTTFQVYVDGRAADVLDQPGRSLEEVKEGEREFFVRALDETGAESASSNAEVATVLSAADVAAAGGDGGGGGDGGDGGGGGGDDGDGGGGGGDDGQVPPVVVEELEPIGWAALVGAIQAADTTQIEARYEELQNLHPTVAVDYFVPAEQPYQDAATGSTFEDVGAVYYIAMPTPDAVDTYCGAIDPALQPSCQPVELVPGAPAAPAAPEGEAESEG